MFSFFLLFILLSFSLSLSLYPSFPFFFTLFFLSSLLSYFFLSVSFSGGRGELPASLTGKTVRGKCTSRGFPSGAVVKNLPASVGDVQTGVWSLGWEDPLEEGMQPTPVFLPGESRGQRSLLDYSRQGHKELDTTEET